jgi:hypothetical protein
MSKNDGLLVEKHTVKELFDKLDAIHTQTTKTNGRVTSLEKEMDKMKEVSVGYWVRQHPWKFALAAAIFTATFISDIRHPLMALITGWVGL